MVSATNIEGICSTCENRNACQILTRSRAKGKVIWHCEEFSGHRDSARPGREKQNPVVMRSGNLIPGWDK